MIDLTDTLDKVKNGEKTCETIVSETIERIRNHDKFNAFLTVYDEDSCNKAVEIDKNIRSGNAGPLSGCVIAVKDIICVKDKTVTCGSHILENFVSPYNAGVIDRLEQAGAIIIGKTNMDEFAMGSSNENSYFGRVLNPADPERVPGGSSGGSAAAVAGGLTPAALGSDTGGSIRQPAAFCGVVGLKPTYGRVSRFGLVAFASSFDQIGPLCRTVRDTALILKTISGFDDKDSTSVDNPVDNYVDELTGEISDLRFALPSDILQNGLDADILSSINSLSEKLSKDGVKINDVTLPHLPYALASYYVIANAEASSNLARYDGTLYGLRSENSQNLQDMYYNSRGEGFGDEVKRRIILGTYVLSAGYYEAYYQKAQRVRRLILNDFETVFGDHDIIIMPVTPTTAFKIGEKAEDPLAMYLSDVFTIPVNLAGLPAISVPCGVSAEGLPIGIQLIGRHFEEAKLLRAAHYIEQNYYAE